MALRIAFIGTGSIAVSHLRHLVRMDEAEIVALCDLSREQVESAKKLVLKNLKEQAITPALLSRAEKMLNASVPYTDYQEMLGSEQLDAVYICLPPFAHGEPEQAVIKTGAHLFVEKPVGLDLKGSVQTLRQIQKSNVIAASGYQLRYAADIQTAKARLADKIIGMAVAMRFGKTPSVSWYHKQSLSGGMLHEMATHEMDLLRNLVGDVESIFAQADTRINHHNNPDYDIFDVNCMTLRFKNGAVGNFSNNFISGIGAPENAQGVHVMADELSVSFVLKQGVHIRTPEGREAIPNPGDPMEAENKAFLKAVAENNSDLVLSSYENGVRTLATTIAADRSARIHEPVRVDEVIAEEAPELI